MSHHIAVGVIVFNTDPELLAKCLQSIRDQHAPGQTITIHVRDNSSNASLRAEFGEWVDEWIAAPNEGFATAANDLVSRSTGDYFLLLNPDAQLSPTALAQFHAGAARYPDAIMCGWLAKDGAIQVDAYLHWWSSSGRLLRRRRYRSWLEGQAGNDVVSVQKCSGAATFAKRDLLAQLGPYDERFFMYGEDVDFSLRARAGGHELLALPAVEVGHAASSTLQTHSPLVERARADAAIRLNAYHLSRVAALVLRLELLVITLFGLVPGARTSSVGRHSRLCRLDVIRGWGLHHDMPRFDPEHGFPTSGSRRRRRKSG